MIGFYEKRKLKKVLYSRPTLVVLIIVILFLLNGVWNIYQKEKSTDIKKDITKEEFDAILEREAVLTKEINRLSTERGKEQEIRKKFNVARVGEEVVVIIDAPISDDGKNEDEEKGFWQRIFDWF